MTKTKIIDSDPEIPEGFKPKIGVLRDFLFKRKVEAGGDMIMPKGKAKVKTVGTDGKPQEKFSKGGKVKQPGS